MGATLFIQREKVDVTVHLNLSLYHYYFMNSRLYTPYCCEHAHYMPTHKIFEICPNFHFTIQVCYACNQSQFIMTLKFSPPNLLVVFARCCLLLSNHVKAREFIVRMSSKTHLYNKQTCAMETSSCVNKLQNSLDQSIGFEEKEHQKTCAKMIHQASTLYQ